MKARRSILFVMVFISFFSATALVAATGLSFAAMEEGDRVEITYSSNGCFHDFTHYYEVSKRGGVPVFVQYAITWVKGIPPKMAEKKVIGELKLTTKEIDGLDAFLRFYRGEKAAASTTHSSLLVEYFEGAKRVGVEKLYDGSGEYGLESRKDVVQFSELVERFPK